MKKFIFIALAAVTLGASLVASAAGYVSDNVKAASSPRVDTEIHY